MGMATVRATLLTFFQSIPQIQKVYKDSPWFLDGKEWPIEVGTNFAAVGFLHLARSNERRIAVGRTGPKRVDYDVDFLFHYQWHPAGGAGREDWVDELDALIDEIKDRIRSDQNAGNPAVVFQMGEDQQQPDLQVEQDLPKMNGTTVYVLCRIEFHVLEIITA